MTKSQAQAEHDVAWDGWTCPHQQERSFSFTFLSSQARRAGTRKVIMDQLMIGSSFLSPQNLAVWCLHNTSHASVILNLPLIQQPFSRNVVRIYLRNNIKTGLSMACFPWYILQLQATSAYRHPKSEAASGPSYWTSLKNLSSESSLQMYRDLSLLRYTDTSMYGSTQDV